MGTVEGKPEELEAPASDGKSEGSETSKPEPEMGSVQESQKSESKKPEIEKLPANEPEKKPEKDEDDPEETKSRTPKKRARKGTREATDKRKKFEALASDPLVTQTFRVPRSLSERLQITSMQRKVKRLFPASQQDIVAEALADWLDKMEDEE
ncbi:hypothetical protein Hsar01_03241 [Haloferula sargassicola]|uniref:Uncharacterized protein n=2 Tax=Haloferula sargassicola TaxID=490096 RepID=A0ABP9UR28_9BACT